MTRIACPACDKVLRIPDSLIGRMVACPKCKEKFRVPKQAEPLESDEDADERISTAPPPPRAKPRKLRPPVDEEDEPLPKPKPSRAKGGDEDQDAFTVESESVEEPARSRRRGQGSSRRRRRSLSRFEDEDDNGSDKRPHRGGLILTLGILSIFLACCPLGGWILGGITMNMASTDARLMEHGAMQRSGRGMTKAGQVCAIIGVFLATINAIVGVYLE